MRISTNFISCSVLLLATIMVKGAQAQCYDDFYCGDAVTACSIDIDCPPYAGTCPDVTNGSCNTCSSAWECTAVTCDTNYFDTNNDATDGCEATCAAADNAASCTACTTAEASGCTALGACNANYFDTNNDATDGCEATCPDVTNGSCDTCSSASDCTAVTCDTNYFNDDSNVDTDACAAWSEPTAADCADGSVWTAGSTTADSTCVECTGGTFSAGNNTACAAWSEPAATGCEDGFVWTTGSTTADSTCVELVWKTIRGCCRERVENSKRGLNHHGTASTETFFGSLDSVLISCTAACATDAVCTAVEVTKKNRAAAKCEFHVERMNAGDRSTKSCKKATCMVKTGFVAPETQALPPAPTVSPTAEPTSAPTPAAHSPTEWNERRGCCREHAGNKKYLNHVGTNIIIAERTYAAATKACKDECDGRSTCTAVETRRNQRKKVYMCELHTASGINASSRASKSCKKALCAVKA